MKDGDLVTRTFKRMRRYALCGNIKGVDTGMTSIKLSGSIGGYDEHNGATTMIDIGYPEYYLLLRVESYIEDGNIVIPKVDIEKVGKEKYYGRR